MPNIIRHFASNANIRGDFSSTYTKPPFRALHSPLSKSTTPAAASVHPPRAKLTTPAAASVHPPSPSFPASIAVVHHSPSPNLSHLPEADVYSPSPFMEIGGADRPGVRSTHAIIPRPHCGRPSFPLSKYTTFASGRCLLPISNYITSASGRCLLPISIYGEGVADRPGGEVYPSPSSPASIAGVFV